MGSRWWFCGVYRYCFVNFESLDSVFILYGIDAIEDIGTVVSNNWREETTVVICIPRSITCVPPTANRLCRSNAANSL